MALPCQLRNGGPRYFVPRCADVAAGFRADLGQPPFDAAFRFSAPGATIPVAVASPVIKSEGGGTMLVTSPSNVVMAGKV